MKRGTKDNLTYLGVGLAIAAGLAFYIFYSERTTGRIRGIPGPILWGILSTPGMIAIMLERFWEQRHRKSLWAISIMGASINAAVMFTAYSIHWEPPLIVWIALTILWVNVMLIVGARLLVSGARK